MILSCLSFYHAVLLSETLTLLITFEQWVLELWYFTWIFPVIRPFHGYHFFFHPLTFTLEFDPFFEQWMLELWYFTWIFPVVRLFRGYYYFLPCDLDHGVWHIFENFNLSYNFLTVSVRVLIFHMSIPCDKTFPWLPLFFTLWPWLWVWPIFLKTLTLLITFEQWVLVLYHMSISNEHWYQDICPCNRDHLWNWPLSGAFVFHKRILYFLLWFDNSNILLPWVIYTGR